jgi:calcineurin-like phosphoesterase
LATSWDATGARRSWTWCQSYVRTYASTPSSPTRRTSPQEGGRGITKESGSALLSVVDFLTLGNHAFDADGYEELLEREESVARPANFGEGLPGQGWDIFEVDGVSIGVTNVLGWVFVEQTPISPFEAADRAVSELEARGADCVLVDTHAEATSEKQALEFHLAGRAQAGV